MNVWVTPFLLQRAVNRLEINGWNGFSVSIKVRLERGTRAGVAAFCRASTRFPLLSLLIPDCHLKVTTESRGVAGV